MDKKKIISSLTMAGLLASSVAGASVFAADTDPDTKALGEYSKLITGKVAVPFILTSESDRVTGKDLKVSFPGKIVTVSDEMELKTGDVVNINGEPRTIVIYGDTNCDGKVNIMDAVTTLNHVKEKATLTGAAFAAADLNNNGSLNILEAVNVLNVVKGKTAYANIATAPTEKSEVAKVSNLEITAATTIKVKFDTDASAYTYVMHDNKADKDVTVSNVAYDKDEKEATITLANAMEAYTDVNKVTYTLTIKDASGNKVSENTFKYYTMSDVSTVNVDDETYADYINASNQNALNLKVTVDGENKNDATVVVTLKDKAEKEVTGTATLVKGAVSVNVKNFSGVKDLKDGVIRVKVKVADENGNATVVDYGTNTLTKNTETLKILDVKTVRNGDRLTSVDCDTTGNATITNKYFMVKKAGESAPSASEIVANDKKVASDLNDVKMTDNVEYKVYVVAENQYGTKSEVATGTIAKATAEALSAVTNIEATPSTAGEFTWKDDANEAKDVKGYKVVVVNSVNNEVVAVKEVTDKKVNVLAEIKDYIEEFKDSRTDDLTSYKIKVSVLPKSSDYKESAVAESSAYTTATLAQVSTPTLSVDGDKHNQKLTWAAVAEASFYNVKFYKYDKDGNKATDAIKTVAVSTSSRECDLTSAMSSLEKGKYAVTVTAMAATSSEKVDGAESDAVDTYNVKAPADLMVSLKSDNETAKVEFSEVENLVKNESNITYKAVYGQLKSNGEFVQAESARSSVDVSIVDGTSLYRTEAITSLDENSTYGFYVKVMYAGKEVARTSTVKLSTPKEVVDLTTAREVKKYEGLALGANTIAVDGSTLYIDGKEYKSNTDLAKYSTLLAAVKVLNEGDEISINADNKMLVEINKTNSNIGSTALKDAEVTIATANIAVEGTMKKAIVAVDGVNLQYATVTEKVEIDGSSVNSIKLKAGTVAKVKAGIVKINDIKLTVASTTEVKVTATGLEVEGKTTAVTVDASEDATVKFTGIQSGAVTAKADEDKTLTIEAESVNTLDVATGKVNVSNVNYVTLTIASDAKVVTTTKIEVADYTIIPVSGIVTVEKTATGYEVIGNAKVKFDTDADRTDETKEIKAENGNNSAAIGTSSAVTVTNLQGSTTYVVNDEGKAIVTVNGDTTFAK